MVQRRCQRRTVECFDRRAVAIIHREGAQIDIRVRQCQVPVQVGAFSNTRVGSGLKARCIVDRVDRDVCRHRRIIRERNTVRAGPQETVGAVEILIAQIHKVSGQQVRARYLLTRYNGHAAECQCPVHREGFDPDCLQRVAIGIKEARIEYRGIQHNCGVFVAGRRNRRDRRRFVAIDLNQN